MAHSDCGCLHRNDRRTFLKFALAGTAAAAFGPHLLTRGAHARETEAKPAKTKAVILLWMGGGPSQLDTWDPKPGTQNGGEFRAIDTTAAGMQISEHLPKIAAQGHRLSILRSVNTREAAHERGTHLMHTGYAPIEGLEFAPTGTVMSHELSDPEFPLPTFIALSPPAIPTSRVFGERNLPFTIQNPNDPLPNIRSLVAGGRELRRQDLLRVQDEEFAKGRTGTSVERAVASSKKAMDMMTTPLLKAFDLKNESDELRKEYGGAFGQKCLLARRLVEVGIPFIEIGLGGWDNHQRIFDAVKRNSKQLDDGMGTLLRDLGDRGMLGDVMVLWMGEFGRTPTVNPQGGRDVCASKRRDQ